MAYTVRDLVNYLDTVAPPSYQESYDNAQLITGDPEQIVKGVLCTLDATEAVVAEAVRLGCNMIVAHHPIVFKGLKSLTGKNYVERTVIAAIRQEVAIFAIHTNLDHVKHGVNQKIADKIGLSHTHILQPKRQLLSKLTTFVPNEQANLVLEALFQAGAGNIGEYSGCSYLSSGTGTYTPSNAANPQLGERGKPHREPETKIEVMLPSHLEHKVLTALRQAHPYEEVAYFLHGLDNEHQEVGAGMLGELPEPIAAMDFLRYIKGCMALSSIRHTELPDRPIRKVAVCGGAGIFLLPMAKRAGADAFVTADVKYHEFFDAEGQLLLCDIGHYESEIFTKELLGEFLSRKFPNIALYLSKVVTNPITYL